MDFSAGPLRESLSEIKNYEVVFLIIGKQIKNFMTK